MNHETKCHGIESLYTEAGRTAEADKLRIEMQEAAVRYARMEYEKLRKESIEHFAQYQLVEVRRCQQMRYMVALENSLRTLKDNANGF